MVPESNALAEANKMWIDEHGRLVEVIARQEDDRGESTETTTVPATLTIAIDDTLHREEIRCRTFRGPTHLAAQIYFLLRVGSLPMKYRAIVERFARSLPECISLWQSLEAKENY